MPEPDHRRERAMPRVTGGQAKPATAIAIGTVIVSPTSDVERPARPVGEEDQRGRDHPARHEGGADQP